MARDIIQVEHVGAEHWWQRSTWVLLRAYVSGNGHVVVPTGFVTDGASIPWFMRWRFSPTGKGFGAAIVHDYCITLTGDWGKANKEFDAELRNLEVAALDRILMVAAVKVWTVVRKLWS